VSRKLALEPEKIKKRVKQLQATYGSNEVDILKWSMNLYLFCFTPFHSEDIWALKRLGKESGIKYKFPLLKGGHREYGMVFTFLLYNFLSQKNENCIKDIIFLIYFIYYTGFSYDSLSDLKYKTLYKVSNLEEGFAIKDFKEVFSNVAKYNFSAEVKTENAKVERSIRDKVRGFKNKYKNHEEVELFIRHAYEIAQNGT
jgi:hypothetical protein